MTKEMKFLFEERNARLQGKSSNGDTLPLSPPSSTSSTFQNHLQILQKNMVKFLHKLLFLILILSLNFLCTMERLLEYWLFSLMSTLVMGFGPQD
jgi:hypothetical protein